MAQQQPVLTPAVVVVTPVAPPAAPSGSKVELMIIDEVTTKTAKRGDRFRMRLAQPLAVGDHIVIPRGTPAYGEVTDASVNGIAGRSGKLTTKLLYIDYQGAQLALTGSPHSAGQGGNLQIVLATLALTPWGLIAKGNNAKLKAGEVVFGFLVEAFPPHATLAAP